MKKSTTAKTRRAIAGQRAQLIAIEYCLFHYPTLYTGGVSKRSADKKYWIVPIVLSSPTHGWMGEVGRLLIDAYTGKVLDSTDRAQVVARGESLYREHNHASATPVRPTRG
jgi:hypothetical protein